VDKKNKSIIDMLADEHLGVVKNIDMKQLDGWLWGYEATKEEIEVKNIELQDIQNQHVGFKNLF